MIGLKKEWTPVVRLWEAYCRILSFLLTAVCVFNKSPNLFSFERQSCCHSASPSWCFVHIIIILYSWYICLSLTFRLFIVLLHRFSFLLFGCCTSYASKDVYLVCHRENDWHQSLCHYYVKSLASLPFKRPKIINVIHA